jgi:para-nitrobenzyl esterase
MLGSTSNAVDADLARRVRGYWSSFAHDGVSALGSSSLRV